MKRCPQCHRVETDKALKFCRVDGTPLVTAATSEPEPATMALPASRPSEEITTGRLRVTPSIAVLPFANMSADPENEYFCDGLAEELLNALAKIDNLKVAARTSSFSFKGKNVNVDEIGRALCNQTDLVSLQNEIARDVSSKLKLKLSGADQQKLAKTYTSDPEAYRFYLQGRFYLNKRVGNLFDRADAYFQQAIEKDPNFALGYVGLAEFLGERDRPKAKEYIMRALAIDNQLSDAHASLGYQLMLDYDFAASEREFRRAIELDPNNARAYQWNGSRLMMIGLYDQALASFDRAIEIEPTLPDIRNNRGGCLVAAGRIDDGIAEIKKSMELDPTFPWTHSHISYVYRMREDRAASVEERARAFELLDRGDQAKRMRESFATSGWTGYLREILSQNWGRLGTSETRRASLLSELGEKEEAIASLNDAAAKGDYWLFSIKYDPAFDPLRGDPRFQTLLKKFDPPR
jgi:tetratricopeptide (TPR) repeat protein